MFHRDVPQVAADVDLQTPLRVFGLGFHIVSSGGAVLAKVRKNSVARSWHQSTYSRLLRRRPLIDTPSERRVGTASWLSIP